MKNISDFCERKGITSNMQEAFIAYVRSDYAHRYYVNNGETLMLVVSRLTVEEIEEAWLSFVTDFKNYLTG